MRLLAAASRLLADRCVAGITANEEQCRTYAESSPSIATSLNPYLGYERTAKIIKESLATGVPIRQLVEDTGELTADQVDEELDALSLTGIDRRPPGGSKATDASGG